MIPLLYILLAYVTGGFHSDIISKETYELIEKTKPEMASFLDERGFNGMQKDFEVQEVMSKVVNGMYRAVRVKIIDTDASACFMIYTSLKGTSNVEKGKICQSIIEII